MRVVGRYFFKFGKIVERRNGKVMVEVEEKFFNSMVSQMQMLLVDLQKGVVEEENEQGG
jgi:uncharacterized Fe-S cluster-containing protein